MLVVPAAECAAATVHAVVGDAIAFELTLAAEHAVAVEFAFAAKHAVAVKFAFEAKPAVAFELPIAAEHAVPIELAFTAKPANAIRFAIAAKYALAGQFAFTTESANAFRPDIAAELADFAVHAIVGPALRCPRAVELADSDESAGRGCIQPGAARIRNQWPPGRGRRDSWRLAQPRQRWLGVQQSIA